MCTNAIITKTYMVYKSKSSIGCRYCWIEVSFIYCRMIIFSGTFVYFKYSATFSFLKFYNYHYTNVFDFTPSTLPRFTALLPLTVRLPWGSATSLWDNKYGMTHSKASLRAFCNRTAKQPSLKHVDDIVLIVSASGALINVGKARFERVDKIRHTLHKTALQRDESLDLQGENENDVLYFLNLQNRKAAHLTVESMTRADLYCLDSQQKFLLPAIQDVPDIESHDQMDAVVADVRRVRITAVMKSALLKPSPLTVFAVEEKRYTSPQCRIYWFRLGGKEWFVCKSILNWKVYRRRYDVVKISCPVRSSWRGIFSTLIH